MVPAPTKGLHLLLAQNLTLSEWPSLPFLPERNYLTSVNEIMWK